jgi:hypothetical protein
MESIVNLKALTIHNTGKLSIVGMHDRILKYISID